FVLQKLWLAAQDGNLTAQLLYMLMPVWALEAITHTTQYFLNPWVHMAAFLLPALLLARRRHRSSDSSEEEAVADEPRQPDIRPMRAVNLVPQADRPAWTSGQWR